MSLYLVTFQVGSRDFGSLQTVQAVVQDVTNEELRRVIERDFSFLEAGVEVMPRILSMSHVVNKILIVSQKRG